MQLAFCGQLVFRTSVNTKRLQADYYKEIILRYAVIGVLVKLGGEREISW